MGDEVKPPETDWSVRVEKISNGYLVCKGYYSLEEEPHKTYYTNRDEAVAAAQAIIAEAVK